MVKNKSMKVVMTGSIKSSKEKFNLLRHRKNSIDLSKLVEFIKLKKIKKK